LVVLSIYQSVVANGKWKRRRGRDDNDDDDDDDGGDCRRGSDALNTLVRK